MTEIGSNSTAILESEYRQNGGFSDFRITGNDISMVMWDGLKLSDVLFENNNMRQMSLKKGCYCRTGFIRSDLRSSNLSGSELENVNFSQCSLIKMDISGSHIYNCSLTDCSAESLNLQNSRIVKSRFNGSELFRLDCRDAVIINSEFSINPESCLWGLQEAIFNRAIIINTMFHGINYDSELFAGSLFINCRFEN